MLDIEKVFRDALKAYEKQLKKYLRKSPPKGEFACKQGCNICCSQERLPCTAVELFVLEVHLREVLTSDELEALACQLDEIAKRKGVARMTRRQLPIYPCPFLKEEIGCSVYELRPLCCRGHNSYFVSDCEEAFKVELEGVIVRQYTHKVTAARKEIAGIREHLKEQGLESGRLDLHWALQMVLRDSSIKERWLRGERVFGEACMRY